MDPAQEFIQDISSRHRAMLRSIGGNSAVRRAYEGSTVFVTGGAGFMGKHFLEKLLRCCHVKKVYLLLRPKKGKNVKDRLETLVTDPIFDSLRESQKDFADRLEAIDGDVRDHGLGLSQVDWHTITEETEVIFHGAATVNFVEPIKVATLTNVRGTREMVTLARACRKLKAFVYISTAYSNATSDRIGKEVLEDFYQSPIPADLLIRMAETIDEKVLNDITPNLLQKWPNTYTFTKASSEDVLRAASDLPISIVRPAIVISSYREPEPGWIDPSNVMGPSGLVLGGGLGVLHVIYASKSSRIDMVPVDYVSNAIIAAGWAAMGRTRPKIYTLATTRNFATWDEKNKVLTKEVLQKYMTPKAMWYAFWVNTDNKYMYLLLTWLLHYIPAYILDAGCWVLGKPRMFIKLYTKAAKLSEALRYFTTNNWDFGDQNLMELQSSMTEDDQVVFNCDMASIDWRQQCILWALAVRRHMIRDGLNHSREAARRQSYYKILHYLLIAGYFPAEETPSPAEETPEEMDNDELYNR